MLDAETASSLFFALIVGHAVCDYPLQGDFIAKAKNRFNPIPGVPWYQGLAAHAAIHAGAVWLITGSGVLGFVEFICHAWIDDRKCRGDFGYDVDQALHVLTKALIVTYVVFFGAP